MCVFEDKRLQRTVKGRQGKAAEPISAALLFAANSPAAGIRNPLLVSGWSYFLRVVVTAAVRRRVHIHASVGSPGRCDVSASRIISAVVPRVCDRIAARATGHRRFTACRETVLRYR
jgi:hypothetical protein